MICLSCCCFSSEFFRLFLYFSSSRRSDFCFSTAASYCDLNYNESTNEYFGKIAEISGKFTNVICYCNFSIEILLCFKIENRNISNKIIWKKFVRILNLVIFNQAMFSSFFSHIKLKKNSTDYNSSWYLTCDVLSSSLCRWFTFSLISLFRVISACAVPPPCLSTAKFNTFISSSYFAFMAAISLSFSNNVL